MIRSVELCFTHAMMLGGKRSFRFERGVNVVIGPNGSGMSTLLRALHECGECSSEQDEGSEIHYFNSESMNPHNRSEPDRSPLGMLLRTRGMFSSHGEIMKAAMVTLPVREGGVLLIDEPEAGQDLAGVRRLVAGFDMLAKRDVQVIVATHHPLFFTAGTLIELDPGYAARVNRDLCAALDCDAQRRQRQPAIALAGSQKTGCPGSEHDGSGKFDPTPPIGVNTPWIVHRRSLISGLLKTNSGHARNSLPGYAESERAHSA